MNELLFTFIRILATIDGIAIILCVIAFFVGAWFVIGRWIAKK